jgi:hypothetical protein
MTTTTINGTEAETHGLPQNDNKALMDELLWGVSAISKEINRTPRQTFYLLETGRLPAQKFGRRWCATRSGLRRFFSTLLSGKVA